MIESSSVPDQLAIRASLKASRLPACICRSDHELVAASSSFLELCQLKSLKSPLKLDELVAVQFSQEPFDPGQVSALQTPCLPVALKTRPDGPSHIIAWVERLNAPDDCYRISLDCRTEHKTWPPVMEELVPVNDQALFVCDSIYRIASVNQAALDLFACELPDLQTRKLTDLYPAFPCQDETSLADMVASGASKTITGMFRVGENQAQSLETELTAEQTGDEIWLLLQLKSPAETNKVTRFSDELEFVLEKASDSVFLYDHTGRIHFVNEAGCQQLGYSRDELLSMNLRDIDATFSLNENMALQAVQQGNSSNSLTSRHKRRDGSEILVEVRASSCLLGNKVTAVAFVRNIEDQLAISNALIAEEERFRVITDTSPVALIICNYENRRVQYANKQAEALFGLKRNVIIDKDVNGLFSSPLITDDSMPADAQGMVITNKEISIKPWNRRNVWASVNASNFTLQGEKVTCLALLDITESRELSRQLSYQASYDDLTGLINRREFNQRLQLGIDSFDRSGKTSTVLFLDLDQFKIVNDSCGHLAGDELLQKVARLLESSIRIDDVLARLGGDEFAVLLENCGLESGEEVARKIKNRLQSYRFVWGGRSFNITSSIGVVETGPEPETLIELMRRADNACHMAKEAGSNRIYVLRSGDVDHSQRQGEMLWVSRLNEALDHNYLQLWGQAINDTARPDAWSGHVEVLLRMRLANGEIVMPGNFLPIAERYGMASRVDRWVINRIFNLVTTSPEVLKKYTRLSINLSGQSVGDEEFQRSLIYLLKNLGVPASTFCFEVTETAAISNLAKAASFMRSIQQLGASLSLDDFGSGLSSFGYLKTMPVDYVKIDGQFVRDVLNDKVDLALVKSINDMAHAVGKKTIAEFVESPGILKVMQKLGVDYVQGFGIAGPVPLEIN